MNIEGNIIAIMKPGLKISWQRKCSSNCEKERLELRVYLPHYYFEGAIIHLRNNEKGDTNTVLLISETQEIHDLH